MLCEPSLLVGPDLPPFSGAESQNSESFRIRNSVSAKQSAAITWVTVSILKALKRKAAGRLPSVVVP